MDKAEVAVSGLVVAGGKSPGIFKLVEAAFDHVEQALDGGVDRQLGKPLPLGREDSAVTALLHIIPNEVSVIAFVGEEHLGC